MRLIQILKENDNADDIMSALSSLISVLKSKGHENIPTQYAVNYINNMGYSVDNDSLANIAVQSPFVTSATPEELTIGNNAEQEIAGTQDAAIGQDVVNQMATDTAMGDIQQ